MSSITEEQRRWLIDHAEKAVANSYSPYSNFKVGAAVLTDDDQIYSGCNVENISIGLSSCAERNAIFSAISQQGLIKILAVALANGNGEKCSPCGACRQIIAEFGPQARIIYRGSEGYQEQTINELLPDAFNELTP